MPPIFQVDAFTDRPFGGNSAAVCLLERAADSRWMQQVALEMNLAETAFLEPRGGDQWNLRWFTPAVEVKLCGHATLAAAHALFEQRLTAGELLRFHTLSGVLEARRRGEQIEIDLPACAAHEIAAPPGLLAALGVAGAVWIGENVLRDYLVELESEEQLRSLDPDFRALRGIGERGTIVTARAGGVAYDCVSRFFAPAVGIDEDPVTGSAHCALAPYWARKLGKHELVGYQASPRGGTVWMRVDPTFTTADPPPGARVLLAGHAVTVLRGDLIAE